MSGDYVDSLANTHRSRHPGAVHDSSSVPDAAAAYRRMLAQATDGTVVIAAIGFMVALRDLLTSPPDAVSPLDGVGLVKRKVRKIVFQGGWYAPLHPNGRSTFNWDCGGAGATWSPYALEGCRGAAKTVIDLMPDTVQMVFSDIGDSIYHGGRLIRYEADENGCAAGTEDNPCREAYRLHSWGINRKGRQSWDDVVVLAAVRGPEAINCTETDVGYRNVVDDSGANFWTPPATPAEEARQSQLALVGNVTDGWRQAREDAGNTLDQLLCKLPANGPGRGTT